MREYTHYGIRGATDEAKNNATVPSWLKKVWQSRGLDGFNDPVSLATFGTDDATTHETVNVAYGRGEETDDFEVTQSNKAVVDAESGELFSVVSNRYELIENEVVVDALTDVLCDFNVQDDVYGEARDYGAFVNIDLYFTDDGKFRNPDTGDTMAFGAEIRASHDRSSSVRGRLITRDGYCRNTLRGISEVGWRSVGHYGSSGERGEDADAEDDAETAYEQLYDLFARLLFELLWYADAFVQDIERASDTLVDFDGEAFSVREFYDAWLPDAAERLKDAAAQRAFYRAGLIDDPDAEPPSDDVQMSVWALVSGFTYAVTHVSNASDGSTRDGYNRDARDALSAPERFVENVRRAHETADEDDGTVGDEVDEDDPFAKAALTKREIEAVAD